MVLVLVLLLAQTVDGQQAAAPVALDVKLWVLVTRMDHYLVQFSVSWALPCRAGCN
jgi:hypothetical protein